MRSDVRVIRRRLLKWGRSHYRRFWWRELRDPYAIAVIEVLLRQTRAETIESSARMFIEKYATPEMLASASLGELRGELRIFGLHEQRAKQLRSFGEAIAAGHRLLNDERSLREMPGIGPYAASAVRCFAFGARVPVIDVNVARIVSRVFDITPERGELRKNRQIRNKASSLLEGSQPREVNWALLDLGSLVCISGVPRCGACPLDELCAYRRADSSRAPMA